MGCLCEELEGETKALKKQVQQLRDELSSVDGMHMELTILRESRDRERDQVSAKQANLRQLEAARDAALSEAEECRRSLAAAQADRDVAKADATRAITANANLQQALAAFQEERQAELDMLAAQHDEAIKATEEAAEASRTALKQVHERELKQIQIACDAAVKHGMDEIQTLENFIAKHRAENNQLRRLLEEAITQLQSNQEDVVDRTLMKNILLDWCTVTDRDRRQQILQLLASMLHFTESEREKVHLSSHSLHLGGRFVTAIAPSLPPPRMKEVAGENVREKWVNFLLIS